MDEELSDPNSYLTNGAMKNSKLSLFCWNNQPVPRTYKQSQHVRGSKYESDPQLVNNKTLFWFRCVACFLMWSQMIFNTVYEIVGWHMIQLQYMTIDGVYLTSVTLLLLVIAHRKFDVNKDLAWSQSPWCLWKWCQYLFQLTYFVNFIITLIFWGFILPTGSLVTTAEGDPVLIFKFTIDHTLPCLYTTIDWCLNGISFEKNQILPNTCIIIGYGAVNFLYVLITDEEIYPYLTWEGGLAWALVALIAVIVVAIQAFTCWCTGKKIHKIINAYNLQHQGDEQLLKGNTSQFMSLNEDTDEIDRNSRVAMGEE